MRALIVMLGAVAMLIGVATQPASAGKGSDIEQFIKRIGKYAVVDQFAQKPRSLCVCLDGGPFDSKAGVLIFSGQLGAQTVSMRCSVPTFDVLGDRQGSVGCSSYEVLSK